MRYYIFHHTYKDAKPNGAMDIVNHALKNKCACMQYEYKHGDKNSTRRSTSNWRIIKQIEVGDIIFLAGKNTIHAWGEAKKHEETISKYITLNCESIIKRKSHIFGDFSFESYNSYKGIILFDDCNVFYEDLSDEKALWGKRENGWVQRVDVLKWKDYSEVGISSIRNRIRVINDTRAAIREIEKDTAERLIRQLSRDTTFTL